MSDPEIESAWRALAEADAQLKAPAALRSAVMAAWDAAATQPTTPSRSTYVLSGVIACTTIMVVAIGLTLRPPSSPVVPNAVIGMPAGDTAPAAASDVPAEMPVASTPGIIPNRARRAPRPSLATDSARPAPLVRLFADPRFETESLQVVRLRMPRASLEMFGLAVLDPDSSSLVDVDVIVGDDGFPRDIRRIRPVVDVSRVQ